MAGTVTTNEIVFESVKKLVFDWLSDASGDADGPSTASFTGKILAAVTIPDGVDAPTALYDVTLTDADGVDVLAGAGADRSATLQEQLLEAVLGAVASSKLTITVSNAGNAKRGKLILFIR